MKQPYNINRTGLVVRPKQPYIEWALSVVAPLTNRSPDDLNIVWGERIYLLRQVGFNSENDIPPFVRRYSDWIFEFELCAWTSNEKLWPKRRDFEAFCEWFDAQTTMIWDLDRGEIITYGDE